jgi:hypothetical protein
MKRYRIVETRVNEKGEEFIVETAVEAQTKEALEKYIERSSPAFIKDRNYRIKEID